LLPLPLPQTIIAIFQQCIEQVNGCVMAQNKG